MTGYFQTITLPPQAQALFESLKVSPRLIAHHLLVYGVAQNIIDGLQRESLVSGLDTDAVLLGAALHDIGKLLAKNEMIAFGSDHEVIGEKILLENGFHVEIARFARTHGYTPTERSLLLEDLLVQLADKLWKGKRDDLLEQTTITFLAEKNHLNYWEIYPQCDQIFDQTALGADQRLAWYLAQPLD